MSPPTSTKTSTPPLPPVDLPIPRVVDLMGEYRKKFGVEVPPESTRWKEARLEAVLDQALKSEKPAPEFVGMPEGFDGSPGSARKK